MEKVGRSDTDGVDTAWQKWDSLRRTLQDADEELIAARAAREDMGDQGHEVVDAANERIRTLYGRSTRLASDERSAYHAWTRAKQYASEETEIADNLSFRLTPELKAAIASGQPGPGMQG